MARAQHTCISDTRLRKCKTITTCTCRINIRNRRKSANDEDYEGLREHRLVTGTSSLRVHRNASYVICSCVQKYKPCLRKAVYRSVKSNYGLYKNIQNHH